MRGLGWQVLVIWEREVATAGDLMVTVGRIQQEWLRAS